MGDFVNTLGAAKAADSDDHLRRAVLRVVRQFPAAADRSARRDVLDALGLLNRIPGLFGDPAG